MSKETDMDMLERGPCMWIEEMDDAAARAWRSLARYKFWMFGYHAAQWVLLNRLSGLRRPNPFFALVKMARQQSEESEAA